MTETEPMDSIAGRRRTMALRRAMGTTAALATGPYDPCGAWADALFDHPETPDGLLFSSRHNPDETCIALFERKDIVLTRQRSISLPDMLADVGRLLDRHGKSVFGAP
ncbi:RES family NAD+ phosphorylase [Cereibacter sphaeroides]|uniref:RES family NAD+ phosphorylase n=2 Tax=Cereibacter sphaeroides TaxID=1063 RepID=UPI003FCDF7B8